MFSDGESVVTAPAPKQRKLKRIMDSDDEGESPVMGRPEIRESLTSRQVLIQAASPPLKKAKVDAPVASIFNRPKPESKLSSPPKAPAKATGTTASLSQKDKPLASIFQRPAKVEKPRDEDEHVPAEEEEGEDEISDEEMEEQEEKAASKL